jgi:hypothetical protein
MNETQGFVSDDHTRHGRRGILGPGRVDHESSAPEGNLSQLAVGGSGSAACLTEFSRLS